MRTGKRKAHIEELQSKIDEIRDDYSSRQFWKDFKTEIDKLDEKTLKSRINDLIDNPIKTISLRLDRDVRHLVNVKFKRFDEYSNEDIKSYSRLKDCIEGLTDKKYNTIFKKYNNSMYSTWGDNLEDVENELIELYGLHKNGK